MPKDYARRHTARRASRKKNGGGGAWLLWLVLGGLAVFGWFYWKQHRHELVAKLTQVAPSKMTATKKTVSPKAPAPPASTTAPQPQFDFYTLLPHTQLPAPNITTSPSANPAALPHYLLRVASLKNPPDADRLKAELTLLGFDVILEAANVHGVVWTRVAVGPYTSLADARADRKRLQQNNINSLLVKTSTLTSQH